ncbi:HD domain-containing protein [Algoriphagus locisalis]|uniref:HD domain-containing protein n=1 Tax=Algoriphagus locisalis TaxID=305507 RepID=A0A1I6XKW5_9BACT|nr:HD domain-containing protein [Algoriphagus locisalis]SFT38681.1 HD domain-containing protein [Algoriphagus locisalis]
MDKQLENFEFAIRKMFAEQLIPEVCYHNLDHTLSIVSKVKEIGESYQLDKIELENLFISGWLHDVGYWGGVAEDHEKRGAEFALEFLEKFQVPKNRITMICQAILATKIPQKPQNLMDSIICDADLYHLSSDQFYDQTLLLKKENEQLTGKSVELLAWLRNSEKFMEGHHYHTDYAVKYYRPGKLENLNFLRSKIEELANAEMNSSQ